MQPNQSTFTMRHCLVAALLCLLVSGATADEAPVKTEHFMVVLDGTREGWPENMTETELEAMQRHYVYLRNLMYEGKMLLAGPAFGLGGIVVLNAADEAEARRIMDNEPSVTAGVHTYRLFPFVASLVHGRDKLPEPIADQRIDKSVTVNATLGDVWNAFTTEDGLEQFMGINSTIELRPGGRYEWYFVDDAPFGRRGGEGCRVLSYLPQTMLSFTWNAPPQFEKLRPYRTWVVLTFEERDDGTIAVKLSHLGWGEGDDWRQVYEYFDSAWEQVLGALKKQFG